MQNMLNSRWMHTVLLLALLCGAVVVRGHDYEWSRSLRYLAFDAFNKLHPRQPTDQVVVVDLDEVSMGRDDLGQWPWPRNTVATMVDKLKAMGAKAVVFDMVFAESDRTSPSALLKSMPELKADLAAVKDHDQQLADSFTAAGNVVAGFVWSPDKKATRRTPVLSKSILLSGDADGLRRSVLTMVGVTTTIPELAQAAAGNGCFCVAPEVDGLIRQVPLLTRFDAEADKAPELYPSLALEALRVSQDPRINVKVRHLRPNEIGPLDAPYKMQVGQYEIPLDVDGKFFVYFSKARPEKYIPAWQVFDGAVDPAKIKDKIVLIGTSAQGLKDIRSTPLDLFIPGVEVHVNVIEQVMTGQYLLRPALLSGVEFCFIIAIGLLIILLAPFVGAVVLAGLTMVLVGGIGYASWTIFLTHGLLLDPVYPSLTILALFVLASLLAYIRTESERKQVRTAFSHYISPDFMKELTDNPEKLKLGGEMRDLSVMFTDIRGFTGISEKLTPEALIHLMNDFLTPMSSLVMENRGTIDKYMGDAMMAFWNAPLDDPDHARHACITALKMNQALIPINENIKDQGIVLAAGIGIYTGRASVGNMGSRQRFAYSALGDTVNTASRLEGQTKAYGVSVLIGESTAAKVQDMALLELDLLRAKGKKEPVRIYTLIGDEVEAQTAVFKNLAERHGRMMAAYRAQDFDTALSLIRECSGQIPAMDGFYGIMAERIAVLDKTRPGDGWDGVYEATSK